MSGGYLYLQQDFKNYQWSNVRFAISKVVGGFSQVIMDLAKENAVGVFIKGIQWDVNTPETELLSLVIISDNMGNPLVLGNQFGSYNAQNKFDYYLKYKATAWVKANTDLITFIVEYQFLSLPERSDT